MRKKPKKQRFSSRVTEDFTDLYKKTSFTNVLMNTFYCSKVDIRIYYKMYIQKYSTISTDFFNMA